MNENINTFEFHLETLTSCHAALKDVTTQGWYKNIVSSKVRKLIKKQLKLNEALIATCESKSVYKSNDDSRKRN